MIFASSGKAQVVAFPGALGFGANATGAATADANGKHTGGNVYHVTNLNDSGSGSFRDAVSVAGRVVVFDVGGYNQSRLGDQRAEKPHHRRQTAPGGGIGITGAELSFANRSNIICRFLRIRPGSPSASSDDCLSFYRANNIIIDHCSLEFAKWNNIDAVGDSTAASTNSPSKIRSSPTPSVNSSGRTQRWWAGSFVVQQTSRQRAQPAAAGQGQHGVHQQPPCTTTARVTRPTPARASSTTSSIIISFAGQLPALAATPVSRSIRTRACITRKPDG